MRAKPSDWLLLVVSALFTLAGGALLVFSDEPRKALGPMVFFGGCTAIAAYFLAVKVRFARNDALPGQVTVAPGRIPEARGRILAAGVGLTVVGAVLVTTPGFSWLFTAAAAVIAVTGPVVLISAALGWIGSRWLAFEPEGLRVGDRHGSWLLHWDNVATIDIGEFNSNPLLWVGVHDAALAIASTEPPERQAHTSKQLTVTGHRGVLSIMPLNFAMDAGLLARSIDTYARDPSRRAELGRPLLDTPR